MASFDPPQHDSTPLCALVQDLLPLYIEDEVSTNSRAMIVEHLNECPHCAGFLAGAQSVRAQFQREQSGRPVRIAASLSQDLSLPVVLVIVLAAAGIMGLVAMLGLTYLSNNGLFGFGGLVYYLFDRLGWYLMFGAGLAAATVVGILWRSRLNRSWLVYTGLASLVLGAIGVVVFGYTSLLSFFGAMLLALGGASLWYRRDVISDYTSGENRRGFGLLVLLLGLGGLMLFGARFSANVLVARPAMFESGSVMMIDTIDTIEVPTALPPDELFATPTPAPNVRFDVMQDTPEELFATATPVPYTTGDGLPPAPDAPDAPFPTLVPLR